MQWPSTHPAPTVPSPHFTIKRRPYERWGTSIHVSGWYNLVDSMCLCSVEAGGIVHEHGGLQGDLVERINGVCTRKMPIALARRMLTHKEHDFQSYITITCKRADVNEHTPLLRISSTMRSHLSKSTTYMSI